MYQPAIDTVECLAVAAIRTAARTLAAKNPVLNFVSGAIRFQIAFNGVPHRQWQSASDECFRYSRRFRTPNPA
jgi:hypothetical protein